MASNLSRKWVYIKITLNEAPTKNISELRKEILKKAKIELRMNLSLLETLKVNTELEDIANLRERWIEPLERLIKEFGEEEQP